MTDIKICSVCGKKPLERDEVGITQKLIDRHAVDFYCLPCLAAYLEVDEEALVAKIEEFKEEGCTLFT